jgi:hypothetical protein
MAPKETPAWSWCLRLSRSQSLARLRISRGRVIGSPPRDIANYDRQVTKRSLSTLGPPQTETRANGNAVKPAKAEVKTLGELTRQVAVCHRH